MTLLKYFIGSLIISFGVLIVLSIILMAVQVEVAEAVTGYLLVIWIGLAILILPFAKKIIRI